MPIYEYECQHCKEHFEILQRASELPQKECPSCHQEALERLISKAAFHLKGGGWYKDGYASSSVSSNAAKADTTPTKNTQAEKGAKK